MCIKFAFRRNLIYPIQYIIWSFGREILSFIIFKRINFTNNAVYLPTMFFGEIFAGGIFYLYEKRVMKSIKKEKEEKGEDSEKYFMSIKLIENEKEQEDEYFTPLDSKKKIIFLIFLSALFDDVQFLLSHVMIPSFHILSPSFGPRLNGFSTLFATFFYVYALKLPVFRHHQISLSIIGICLIIIIATEYIFNKSNSFFKYYYLAVGLGYSIVSQILVACKDSLEKYLFEYDFMDPFVVLMYEGIFGYLLSFLLLLDKNYFNELSNYYNSNSKKHLLLLNLGAALFVYMILSGGKNLFRVVTNKIYSPMTKTLADYFLNPIYLSYYFGECEDFRIHGKFDAWYFSINIVISLIISFFGCAYDEFIILLFCNLERDTHDQISRRASKIEELTELFNADDEDEEEEESENSSNILNKKNLKKNNI